MTRKATSKSGKQSGAAAEPSKSKDATKFRSALSRARLDKSMGKFADKEFATKDPLVKAAYDEAKRFSENAYNPRFSKTSPVPQLTSVDKAGYARGQARASRFLKLLNKLLKGRLRRGDPLPKSAERAAAHRSWSA